jgi:hypothetical protein
MCLNSGATDSIGSRTTITFTMIGIEIDPNGGTWSSWQDTKLPNLIFTFNNTATTCCGGPWGSWHGTVFSTADSSPNNPGSVAKINGTSMGVTTGNADGSWLGIKAGTGHVSAPVVRGLAVLETGWNPTAPYGNASLQIENAGTVAIGTNAKFAVQAQRANFPLILAMDVGLAKGARPSSVPGSLLGFGGFGGLYVTPPFLAVSNLGTDAAGRALLSGPIPNDPNLKGLNILMQAVSVGLTGTHLTNPAVVEFK